jgi:hypothetical protein
MTRIAALDASIAFDSSLSVTREPPCPYSNSDRAGVSRFIGTRGIETARCVLGLERATELG